MVQLVFVHGVANRDNAEYQAGIKLRDSLFQSLAFPGLTATIYNAYWGRFGAEPVWKNASLPGNGKVKTFGIQNAIGGGQNIAPTLQSGDAFLTNQSSFSAAVDALFIEIVTSAEQEGRLLTASELSFFRNAGAYAEANPKPLWFKSGMKDVDFIMQLRGSIADPNQPGTFAITDPITNAAKSVVNRARNLFSTGLTELFRDDLNAAIGRFIGDVFVYLKDGPKRESIRAAIAAELMKAYAAKAPDEAVVVVGHSLGGVILVDMLTDPNYAGLNGFRANLLMTVGSQPGFFEELKLFASSQANCGPGQQIEKAPGPANVDHWWNVFDPVDILSFRSSPIFESAEDFEFSSLTGLSDAHSSYFKRPSFYQRMKKRLAVPMEGLK